MNGGITCPVALVKVKTVICDLMLKVIKLGFFSNFSVNVQSCLVTIEDVHRSIEYVITLLGSPLRCQNTYSKPQSHLPQLLSMLRELPF